MKKIIFSQPGNPGWICSFCIVSVFALLAIFPYGCSRDTAHAAGSGKIVYDVTVEADAMNPMVKAMMPSEITTYYTGNKTCTVIAMGMNMMETRMISDANIHQHSTLVSAMGKKIAMVLDQDQVKKNFLDRVPLKIKFTGEKKEIAGVECSEALITDSTENSYPVYFTNEIPVKDPNWSSPFHEIDGMLMEYSIRFGEMVMKLKAKKIESSENDASFFEVPKGYEIITDPSQFNFKM